MTLDETSLSLHQNPAAEGGASVDVPRWIACWKVRCALAVIGLTAGAREGRSVQGAISEALKPEPGRPLPSKAVSPCGTSRPGLR